MKGGKLLGVLVLLFSLFGGCISERAENAKVQDKQINGVIVFNLDLRSLQANKTVKRVDPVITSVKVTITREGFTAINKDLTVANNIASGKIENMQEGYWYIKAEVFSGTSKIYEGESDVKVIAEVQVECKILFDPVITKVTTGSINLIVGMNPMPGYKAIQQNADKIMMDETKGKIYIMDNSTKSIGIYNAGTMAKEDDIVLEQAPLSICMNYDKSGFILGYTTGQVYKILLVDKKLTLLGDLLYSVYNIIAVSEKYIVSTGPGSWDDEIKTMDITTGQITGTYNPYDSLGEFTFNEATKTVYTYDTGVSPNDIHFIKIDFLTGKIIAEGDSVYHGDYSFGTPLRIINKGSKLITSSGNMFTSAEIKENDLKYSGNIGLSYTDLVSDDVKESIYLIDRVSKKLVVLNQSNFFTQKTIELKGNPQRVLNFADKIIVFCELDKKYYSKIILKKDIGI